MKQLPTFNSCHCGKHFLTEEFFDDTLYPVNREKTKFNAYCNPSYGGCGRTVYGTDYNDVATKWNLGVTDEKII